MSRMSVQTTTQGLQYQSVYNRRSICSSDLHAAIFRQSPVFYPIQSRCKNIFIEFHSRTLHLDSNRPIVDSDKGQAKMTIERIFSQLRQRGTKSLMPFLTAGDPDLATTEQLLVAMDSVGASVCELGIPFSDPISVRSPWSIAEK